MNTRFTRTKCDCAHCPLRGRRKVRGIAGVDKFKVALIGEAPGADEEAKGEPFIGMAGKKLKNGVATAGMIWHMVYKTNVLMCRPPNNEIDSAEGQEAIEHCMPGFLEELAWMKKQGVKVVAPMGNTAMNALGIEGKISSKRGSVYEVDSSLIAVPTYHPSFIMRGMWKEEPTWFNDLEKARTLSLKKWKKPKENFNIFPTLKDVQEFVDDAIKNKRLIAGDIETTSLNEYFADIIMIGLAKDGENALVIPFTKSITYRDPGSGEKRIRIERYWSSGDETKVKRLLQKLFDECETMWQNALFDVLILFVKGLIVHHVKHDTMLIHHAISPELSHKLEYIVSVYGKTPAWKEAILKATKRIQELPDEESRTYNARDTVVLHQILPDLLAHLKENGTERSYYEVSIPLIWPLIRMTLNGMPYDKEVFKKLTTKFKKEVTRTENMLIKQFDLPDGFNFDSPDHMRLLVWGTRPASYDKVKQELDSYVTNTRKKKDSKKYRELVKRWDIFTKVKSIGVIYDPDAEGMIHIISSRDGSLDADSLITLEQKVLTAIRNLENKRRQTEAIERRIEAFKNIRFFISTYRKFAKANQIVSSFLDLPIGPDGRVHPHYKIHGTKTGRLSSGAEDEGDDVEKINGQNIPEEVQPGFKPKDDRVIVKADYSNIELRVLGIITGEPIINQAFERGEKIHNINTFMLFGIKPDHPDFEMYKRAAKTYVFGRSYGGTPDGIYHKILVKVPEFSMTLTEFRQADARYFEGMKTYKKWCDEVIEKARKYRISETAFGRKRYLLGMPDKIERQALNTPIQGTAGEVLTRSLIKLDKVFYKTIPNSMLVLTVHDSILGECDDKHGMKAARLMKDVMEEPYELCGGKHSFPVEVEIGPSWGETEKVEL